MLRHFFLVCSLGFSLSAFAYDNGDGTNQQEARRDIRVVDQIASFIDRITHGPARREAERVRLDHEEGDRLSASMKADHDHERDDLPPVGSTLTATSH